MKSEKVKNPSLSARVFYWVYTIRVKAQFYSYAFHFNPGLLLHILCFGVYPKGNWHLTTSPITNFGIYQSISLIQLGRVVSRLWISSPIKARL